MRKLMMTFVCIPLLVACNSQVAESNKEIEATTDSSAVSAESAMSTGSAEVVEKVTMSPDEMYSSIESDFNTAISKLRTAYEEAKPSERRKVLAEMRPDSNAFGERFMELAEKHPEGEAAAKSLAWVATNVRTRKLPPKAIDLLFENHADSEAIAAVCSSLSRPGSSENAERLAMLAEKSPHDVVKGAATLALANRLKQLSEQDDSIEQAEYLTLYKKVVNDYADAELNGQKFADSAASVIFEIENLSIGSEAPDIEAEDLDGVVFKLSDYRGKVVVLDFWGHW